MTEKQKQLVRKHMEALATLHANLNVEFECSINGTYWCDWSPPDWDNRLFSDDSDFEPINFWLRIKQSPIMQTMEWDEIPLGEIEWVRLNGAGWWSKICCVGDKYIRIDDKDDGIDCEDLVTRWEYTTDRDPRTANWKRFEVTE